jgi:hypothetical protein
MYNVGDRTETCCYAAFIPLRIHFSFDQESEFSLRKKELISLIILIENFNFDNLYSKPRCHVLADASLISKNTAGVHMLLLKFNEFPACICVHFVFILHSPFPRWILWLHCGMSTNLRHWCTVSETVIEGGNIWPSPSNPDCEQGRTTLFLSNNMINIK